MSKVRIRSDEDWRDNGHRLLLNLFDKMSELQKNVVGYPGNLKELHLMRLAGKPLRYTGEIFEPVFGKKFQICFNEIRDFIELMGIIHDRDVQIPLLKAHLENLQYFNRSVSQSNRISVVSLQACLQRREQERKDLFSKLSAILEKWKKEKFKKKLGLAMEGED